MIFDLLNELLNIAIVILSIILIFGILMFGYSFFSV